MDEIEIRGSRSVAGKAYTLSNPIAHLEVGNGATGNSFKLEGVTLIFQIKHGKDRSTPPATAAL
jgi:hypothetical protein